MTQQFKPKTGGRGIEWCDETRNATGGCLHECKWEMPDGTVAICYAKELAERGVAKNAYPHGFEHHYWRPQMLRQLTAGTEPLLIFCDSMSDLFAANVPAEHVEAILHAMRSAPHHTFQSLTKAAPQLLKYEHLMPHNLWVGVSSPPDWLMGKRLSHRQQIAMLRRGLDILREVKARTGNLVWMSAEPVSWDLTQVIDSEHPLDWIVIGAASKGPRYYQPDPEHIRRLLTVMDASHTPVFFKGNIKPLFEQHDLGTPVLNRWREDFPAQYPDGTSIPAVRRRQRQCRRFGWTVSGTPRAESRLQIR
jgi:protein gp37